MDYLCSHGSTGLRIALHAPGDIPDMDVGYIKVARQMRIIVKPKLITTSPALYEYKVEKRQCLFQNERYLRYFRLYTQANCELECLTNYTLQMCGCVRFNMPKHSSKPICGLPLRKCYQQATGICTAGTLNLTITPTVGATVCPLAHPCLMK